MHLAVYRRRPQVMAIARGHPRHVAAYACAAEPLKSRTASAPTWAR